MTVKVEVVGLDKAGDVVDRALKMRDPELWATRRKNRQKARARAAKHGWNADIFPTFSSWERWLARNAVEKQLSEINREQAESRINLYAEEMVAGRWRFSPDPVVITDKGDIVNGQHRLMAALDVAWEQADAEDPAVPEIVVVWNVPEESALLMDEAARSTKDRRHIALNYAARVRS